MTVGERVKIDNMGSRFRGNDGEGAGMTVGNGNDVAGRGHADISHQKRDPHFREDPPFDNSESYNAPTGPCPPSPHHLRPVSNNPCLSLRPCSALSLHHRETQGSCSRP